MDLRNRWWLMLPLAAVLAIATSGCRKNAARSEVSDVEVVAVGDTSLMLQTVLRQIPRGLEPADSMAMFRSIVETWLRRQVLTEFAERNIPDMEDVDRMVEQYRNDLILSKYLSMMDRTGDQGVSNRRVDRYLNQRRDSMILEEPVVKGIFVKVPEDDSNLAAIREWMKTPGDHSLDRMEKKGLRGATQYEYFLDRWHDWHEVADLVPYRFFDADAFLQDNKDFETSYGGSVYIIHISEYVGSGEKMPQDYARERIRETLRQADIASRRDNMISDIYRHEIKEGRLRKGLYDPATGKISELQTEKR